MNPLKQNAKVKQFTGWFIALFFPFSARAIMDITRTPFVSALIYWVVCGIMLRLSYEKSLPYFKPQFNKIKKEISIFLLATILCAYLFISGTIISAVPVRELILNAFLFALLNGSFEHLVWVNIFDLAGSKIKLNGYIAAFIYVGLIHAFFWGKFMPVPQHNTALFIISQLLIFIIPLRIYTKTKDITLWSIQHIVYNLMAVFFTNFAVSAFLFLK